MATFDIFIKGINPDHTDETDVIRENAAKALQINPTDLDELLRQPNGACIRRDAPEQDAINYQRTFSKLGLICLYSPTKQLTNLELLPIEEEISETITCPNCQNEMPIEEGSEPENCIECGVEITQFLEQKRQNEEREVIKAKLLTSQNTLKAQEAKKQQEDAERQRKAELEKDVLQELGVGIDVKKPLNVKLLAIAGLSSVIAVGSYFFEQSTPPTTKEITPSLATSTQAKSVASSTELAAGSSQVAAPLDAQQAMQKTHDQAAQVLNGFGLNADAFANAGASGSPISAADLSLPEATAPTAAATPENVAPVTTTATPDNVTTSQPALMTHSPELFTAIANDITWDKFLAQNSKILLERQYPEKAAQLNKFIIENEVYIDAMGELLHAAQQAKQTKLVDDYLAALDDRLTSLPAESKAIYFAQASRYLDMENGTNRLLVKAENLLANLPKPELQLSVVLKLAVVYSETGNIANANNYFNKINTLLTPITDLDVQAQSRAAVAIAYQDINNAPVAAQWLSSTEPLIKQLKSETVSALIVSYAKCNQWQNALTLLPQLDLKLRDATLYRAIQVSLQAGFITNAFELQKSLQMPVYKALANVLIAEYSPNATEFLAIAEQSLNSLSAVEKTLVASQLVDYYGKLKNTAKTGTFVTAAQDALSSLPASGEKDALLEAVIKHYAHGFQTKTASHLLTAIQGVQLKMRLNAEVNEILDVGGILK